MACCNSASTTTAAARQWPTTSLPSPSPPPPPSSLLRAQLRQQSRQKAPLYGLATSARSGGGASGSGGRKERRLFGGGTCSAALSASNGEANEDVDGEALPPPLLESSSLPDIFLEMMISERGGEGPPASASPVAEITSPRGFDRLQFPLEAALSLFRPLLPPAEAVRGLKRKEMVEALVSFWERRGTATAARGGPCSGPRASRSSPSRAGRFSARSWWFRGRRAGAAGFA